MFGRVLAVIIVAGCAGCERDPVEHICPDVADGGLVVTEVRGDQTPDDTLGQWIEIYNASGVDQDLAGLIVRVRSISGGEDDRIMIRRSVMVAADGYAVVGLGIDAARPSYVDYAAGTDAGTVLPSSGAIDVHACDDPDPAQFADQLIYGSGLPGVGTYSLGLQPPTAEGNDTVDNWCTSATPMGTPGEANDPCP